MVHFDDMSKESIKAAYKSRFGKDLEEVEPKNVFPEECSWDDMWDLMDQIDEGYGGKFFFDEEGNICYNFCITENFRCFEGYDLSEVPQK